MISRRRFVQLIGAVVATVSVKPSLASSLPRLTGDGIHNDAPALNALLARLPIEIGPLVKIDGAGWKGGRLTLPGGNFLLTGPIDLSGYDGITVTGQINHDGTRGTRLILMPRVCAFRLASTSGVTISDMHIDHQDHDEPFAFASVKG